MKMVRYQQEVKERTYDLKSREQGRMIQVSIPASVPLKEFDYNAEVELINPVADTVANATFRGADVDWYIKADDLVLKGKQVHQAVTHQKSTPTKINNEDFTEREGNELRKNDASLVFQFIFFGLFGVWLVFFIPFHVNFYFRQHGNLIHFKLTL